MTRRDHDNAATNAAATSATATRKPPISSPARYAGLPVAELKVLRASKDRASKLYGTVGWLLFAATFVLALNGLLPLVLITTLGSIVGIYIGVRDTFAADAVSAALTAANRRETMLLFPPLLDELALRTISRHDISDAKAVFHDLNGPVSVACVVVELGAVAIILDFDNESMRAAILDAIAAVPDLRINESASAGRRVVINPASVAS